MGDWIHDLVALAVDSGSFHRAAAFWQGDDDRRRDVLSDIGRLPFD